MSLKDAISAAAKPRIVDTSITYNGVELPIRAKALKYLERKRIIQDQLEVSGTAPDGTKLWAIPPKKLSQINTEFLAAVLIDENDEHIYKADEILKEWDSAIVDKIASHLMKELGMNNKKDDEGDLPNASAETSESGIA